MAIRIPETVLSTLPREAIDVAERYRKDYGDIKDLIHSIKTQGLINPISVTPASEGSISNYVLVAGGRRLAALDALGVTTIPVRIFPNALDELGLRMLELAENLQRKDMTWQESNNLQRRIHQLQQERFGEVKAGKKREGAKETGWSLADTAQMLGVSEAQVGDSIKLAEKFERYAPVLGDPSKYKTENDARKAIKVVEEAMVRAELAKRAKAKENSSSILAIMEKRYIIGDAIEQLAALPANSYDFCECDPPYGINLPDIKNGDTCGDYKELDEGRFILFNSALLRQIYRILKPDTFCIFWFAIDPWIDVLYRLAIEADFTLKKTPMIWTKSSGQSLSPSTTLANAYETALILKKGQPILAKPGRINVFSYSPMAASAKHHPTQKPLELYEDIFQTFSFENANCISPFAGSGASLVAAQLTGRRCIGFDLSEDYKKGYLEFVNKTFMEINDGSKK